jgi:hypothetical protein
MLKTVGKANVEAPFKHWYAIVDNRCWYLGIHLSVESAKEKAIKEFHVQLSKGGIASWIRIVLKPLFYR